MSSRPSRLKYSPLSTTRAPSVSPDCANRNTRSISDEKFSSWPPSLPMPSTISGTSAPPGLRGRPNGVCRCLCAAAAAARMQASASSDRLRKVSATLARPAISRQAMRSISRRRHSRSTRCASAPVVAPAVRRWYSPFAWCTSDGAVWRLNHARASGSRISTEAANSLPATTRGSSSLSASGSVSWAAQNAPCPPARSHHRSTESRRMSGSECRDGIAAVIRDD